MYTLTQAAGSSGMTSTEGVVAGGGWKVYIACYLQLKLKFKSQFRDGLAVVNLTQLCNFDCYSKLLDASFIE